MDIHVRHSNASPERWQAFHFSTLVVCVLGVLGNMSSVVVLIRHLNEIPGSWLLLALAVADLGVVSAIAFRTLSYVTYGNNQFTQVLEWWFLYCYYCSIYLTILLSLHRYLQHAKSKLLLKMNYKKILKRAVIAVFALMLVITLPHLLGSCVRYFQGSNLVRIWVCGEDRYIGHRHLCNVSSSQWEVQVCGNTASGRTVSYSDLGEYQAVVETMCSGQFRGGGGCWYKHGCGCQLISVSAVKFDAPYIAEIEYHAQREANPLRVCSLGHGRKAMRYDPDFVKVVYLGIDLVLRYIIPCLVMFFLTYVWWSSCTKPISVTVKSPIHPERP